MRQRRPRVSGVGPAGLVGYVTRVGAATAPPRSSGGRLRPMVPCLPNSSGRADQGARVPSAFFSVTARKMASSRPRASARGRPGAAIGGAGQEAPAAGPIPRPSSAPIHAAASGCAWGARTTRRTRSCCRAKSGGRMEGGRSRTGRGLRGRVIAESYRNHALSDKNFPEAGVLSPRLTAPAPPTAPPSLPEASKHRYASL